MSNTITTTDEGDHDRDHRLHEAIMLSTKQIVESQQASTTAITAAMEVMVRTLIESQTHNQNQMLEQLTSNFNKGLAELRNSQNVLLAKTTPNDHNEEADEVVQNAIPSDDNQQEDDQMNEVAPVADHQVIQEVNEGIVYDFDGLEPLCQALEEEDWETASRYVRNNQTAIEQIFRAKDLKNEIEFLCTAALSEEQWVLVEEIAKLAPPEALELVYTATGFTLLHLAAMYGNIKIVKALVNKNPRLTQIRSSTGMGTEMVPLTYAAVSASDEQKEIMEYLYPITRDDEPSPFSGDAGGELINALIEANSYGIALSICQRFPDLVKHMVSEAKCEYPLLQMIVDRPIAFYSCANLTWWERCIYPLNMDCPHDSGTPKQKDKLWARSSKGTKKDEENPAVTSKDSAISEDKSTGYTGSMTGNISVNLMRYLMTVPPIKHLCNKKLLHKQAVALVKIGLTCLDETMDEAQQVTYFSNSSIMSTAIKYGTTEFVMECLRMFPFLLYHRDLNLKMSLKISKMIIEERNVKLFNYNCRSRNSVHFHGHHFSGKAISMGSHRGSNIWLCSGIIVWIFVVSTICRNGTFHILAYSLLEAKVPNTKRDIENKKED